jgi:hypothetical protein
MELERVIVDLDAVVVSLKDPEGAGALEAEWSASHAAVPDGPLDFLEEGFVRRACDEAGLPEEVVEQAVATAAQARASDALCALAWHGHYCVYRAPVSPRGAIAAWPSLAEVLGGKDNLFYLLVLLSGMPELQRRYAEHNVPACVARDTLFDIERWMRVHRAKHGAWGLAPDRLNWLRNHMRGELYQLGRLQFQFGAFAPGFQVFRHRSTGGVVALADAGLHFRADGQIDGAGGVVDPDGGWFSHLEEGDTEVRGFPILPEGVARHEELPLPRAAWDRVLAAGDPVLHLHIPAGSPMDFAACGESLQQALAFFPQHFPEKPFVAFACSSWLLDAQLEQMLPAQSNLVRFLQEMYLLPSRSGGGGTLERVFGASTIDPRTAPRDTTLRRAIADHLLAGGHLRGARCFLFPRDLDWGRQVYRRRQAVALADVGPS